MILVLTLFYFHFHFYFHFISLLMKVYGGLSDQDRIFTNLYGEQVLKWRHIINSHYHLVERSCRTLDLNNNIRRYVTHYLGLAN